MAPRPRAGPMPGRVPRPDTPAPSGRTRRSGTRIADAARVIRAWRGTRPSAWGGVVLVALGMAAGVQSASQTAIAMPPSLATATAALTPSTAPLRDCLDCPELVRLPAGTFTMGAEIEESKRLGLPDYWATREQPRHAVAVPQALRHRPLRDHARRVRPVRARVPGTVRPTGAGISSARSGCSIRSGPGATPASARTTGTR